MFSFSLQEDFWLAYEDRLGSTLPDELKAVLTFMGYNCKAALQKFNKEDINKIDRLMTTKLFQIVDHSELKKYYGVFHKKPEMFEIMGGFE